MSWKYAPTRTNKPLAPMLSAAASAIEATLIEWLYVPGARRTSSCNSGCEGSPISSRLKSVSTSNTFSMNGNRPVTRKLAKIAQRAIAKRLARQGAMLSVGC